MAVLISSATLAAEPSVYDRLLYKSIKKNDLVQAEKMLKRNASLKNVNYNPWIQRKKPTVEMIKLFQRYNVPMFSDWGLKNSCLLSTFILDEDIDEELFTKVKLLVDNGADIHCYGYRNPNNNLIHNLIKNLRRYVDNKQRMQSIEYILQKGAKKDLNTFVEIEKKFLISHSLTKPFSHARSEKKKRLLIEYGTKVNDPFDKSGDYPIHDIAYAGHVKLMKDIFPKIKNINIVNRRGYTALDIAHERENDDLELFLLENNAKYNHYKLEPMLADNERYEGQSKANLERMLWIMHRNKNYSEDYKYILKAFEDENLKNLSYLDTLARVYKDNGDKEKAIEIYKNKILPKSNDEKWIKYFKKIEE